MSKRVAV